MPKLPKNVIRRLILVTDLSQQLKKKRDFLRWMSRRYADVNPEQAAAFTTGAEQLHEIRQELLAGYFDVSQVKEELIIPSSSSQAAGAGDQEELK